MITASEFQRISRKTVAELGFTVDYEQEQLENFFDRVAGARRFIDVGANRGLYAGLANHVIKSGYIALVEANPILVERLRSVVPSWPEVNGNSVQVFATAAGDATGVVPFFLDTTDTLGSCVRSSWEVNPSRSIDVPTSPLDTLFAPEARTVIKIDVEGFEYRVLEGARQLLQSKDIRIVMELHGWGDPERKKYPLQVFWLMTRQGFATSRVGISHSYDFVRAGAWRCAVSFIRWSPVFLAKHIVDRMGMRSLAYRILGSPGLRTVWPGLTVRADHRLAELNGEVLRTGGLIGKAQGEPIRGMAED